MKISLYSATNQVSPASSCFRPRRTQTCIRPLVGPVAHTRAQTRGAVSCAPGEVPVASQQRRTRQLVECHCENSMKCCRKAVTYPRISEKLKRVNTQPHTLKGLSYKLKLKSSLKRTVDLNVYAPNKGTRGGPKKPRVYS